MSLDARACYPVQSNVACVAGMLCCLEVCFASGMQVHMLVCMQICICKILEKLGTDCIFFLSIPEASSDILKENHKIFAAPP